MKTKYAIRNGGKTIDDIKNVIVKVVYTREYHSLHFYYLFWYLRNF